MPSAPPLAPRSGRLFLLLLRSGREGMRGTSARCRRSRSSSLPRLVAPLHGLRRVGIEAVAGRVVEVRDHFEPRALGQHLGLGGSSWVDLPVEVVLSAPRAASRRDHRDSARRRHVLTPRTCMSASSGQHRVPARAYSTARVNSKLPSFGGMTKRRLTASPPAASFDGGSFAKTRPTCVRSVAAVPFVV